MEEWRPVVGFEEEYEVSSLGRVRSIDRLDHAGRRQTGRIRIPQSSRGGYPTLNLRKGGKLFTKKVHHLVARAFIGESPGPICTGDGCYEVNHIDGVKVNNAYTNLEYATRTENMRHSVAIGLRDGSMSGERNGRAKLNEESVREIRRLYAAGGTSIPKLAAKFGVGKSAVGYVVQGVTWPDVSPTPAPEQC